MSQRIPAILEVLRRPFFAFIAFAGALAFWALIIILTDFSIFAANLGRIHVAIYTALNILLSAAFGVYLALAASAIRAIRPDGMTGIAGAGAGMLVTGCASCSFTLAASLGLGSFVALLPFSGLELNILGLALVGYSIKKLTEPAACAATKNAPKHF